MSEDNSAPIKSLPNEIITIILKDSSLSCRDVLNFGETCTEFNKILEDNQSLWRCKLTATLPEDICKLIASHGSGDWLQELKMYFNLKKYIYSQLLAMSPKFYRMNIEIGFGDIQAFFTVALSRNINFYITLTILSDVVKKAAQYLDNHHSILRPYTLTDMYYAKVVLRYLIHSYLMLEWVQKSTLNEMPAENIIQFFLQWIDTATIHLKEDTQDKINELVVKVENLLENGHPLKNISLSEREAWAKGQLTDNMWSTNDNRKVLAAIKQVLYQQRHMTVTPGANIDSLDIVKVMNTKFGHATVVAALIEAVARRCGVRCNLIAFSNHMFLEWRENYLIPDAEIFTVNLTTGDLEKKRRCPYSMGDNRLNYKYCPHSLLQYLYVIYDRTMGAIRDWSTQNVFHLLNFVGTNHGEPRPYGNFSAYLTHVLPNNDAALHTPLTLACISSVHSDLIWSLVNLNRQWDGVTRTATVKERKGGVKFALGMICYHTKYDYVCVIRGWDYVCSASPEWQSRMVVETLEYGSEQPFYDVIAADYSQRYVAQENLREFATPNRLYHLEDILAREFSHFDGFCYVPNDEKNSEYPQDGPLREYFKARRPVKTISGS